MLVYVKHITLALMSITLLSCKKEVEIRLTVNVQSNAKENIAKAKIKIDGNEIGLSNKNGTFKGIIRIPEKSIAKLEISKTSPNYYYAPYFKKIEAGNKPVKEIVVDSILYYVPKPKINNLNQDDIPDTKEDISIKSKPDSLIISHQESDNQIDTVKTSNNSNKSLEIEESVSKNESQYTESDKMNTGNENAKDINNEDQLIDIENKKANSLEVVENENINIDEKTTSNLKYEKKQGLYTIHTFYKTKPLANVDIYVGTDESRLFQKKCSTNNRGRCSINFEPLPSDPVHMLLRKDGYETEYVSTRIIDKGKIHVYLKVGNSLDIFTLARTNNYSRGISDIEVLINQINIGKTNRLGHISYPFKRIKDDLISVELRSTKHLPELYRIDIPSNNTDILKKYFTPKNPPSVTLTLVDAKPTGSFKSYSDSDTLMSINRKLRRSVRKTFFSSKIFKEYPQVNLLKNIRRQNIDIEQIIKKGWSNSELINKLDVVLLPVLLVENDKTFLEINLIDSNSKTIVATKNIINDLKNQISFDISMQNILKKIKEKYPFEASILSVEKNVIQLNLGFLHGRSIKKDDRINIYGTRLSKSGRPNEGSKIATARITKVLKNNSFAVIDNIQSRSLVHRGDLVSLNRNGIIESNKSRHSHSISIKEDDTNIPVANANIYINDKWISATNTNGSANFSKKLAAIGNEIKIIKHGYKEYVDIIDKGNKLPLSISMTRALAYLKIESQPSGLNVNINGEPIGKTPFDSPIKVPSGFIKLEIKAPTGFKNHTSILDLHEGTLNLTHENAIKLEIDYIQQANRYREIGDLEKSILKLQDIEESHSDFALSRHILGEIYLYNKKNPLKAAKEFNKVTQINEIKNFQDKRFIVTHLYEAIAIYEHGQSLSVSSKEAAIAHFKRSIEIITRAIPYLRFIKKDNYENSLQQSYYYMALSRHKIWQLTRNKKILQRVIKEWKGFLSLSASDNINTDKNQLIENARIYYKQAKLYQNSNQAKL